MSIHPRSSSSASVERHSLLSLPPSRTAIRQAACTTLTSLAIGLCFLAGQVLSADPSPQQSRVVRYVEGRVLVQPRAGLSDAELDKILKPHGGRRALHLKQINVHVIQLPAGGSAIEVVKALKANPHVKFAELDVVLEPALVVNDPYLASEWHLPQIGAPTAWNTKTGSGVTIAILDTGVDATHPDLTAQMVPGWNFFDNNSNTADVYGHGTHVAGIAAAAGNNGIGVAGVSFGSKLMPIRVTDTSGYGYYSSMAQGIIWAADQGARVANLSFQGACGSSTIQSAAQYMRSKGGVVVAASGNTGVLESYSASNYITVVSAIDSGNNVTSWSSFGPFVDVAAPGVGIYTTAMGGGYASPSGTSDSTPVAAGVYALMISANPTLAASTLDGILFSTATDLGASAWDQYSGWGLVNASAAVSKAVQTVVTDTTAPNVSISSPAATSKISGLVPVDTTATDNVGVARVDLYLNGSLYATDTMAPYDFTLDTTKLSDGGATLEAKAFDAAGNQGTSATISLTVANDTIPPIVTIQSPVNGSTVTGSVAISATATDNNKVAQMSLSIDGKQVALAYGSSLSYSWSSRPGKRKGNTSSSSGTHTIQVTASDPAGNTSKASVYVTVQ